MGSSHTKPQIAMRVSRAATMLQSVDKNTDQESWRTKREYFEQDKEQSRSSLNVLYSPRYASESRPVNPANPGVSKEQDPISRIDVRMKSYISALNTASNSPLTSLKNRNRTGPVKPSPDPRKLTMPNTDRRHAAEVDQSYLQAQSTIFLMNSLREARQGETHQVKKSKYKLIRSARGTQSWDQATASQPSLRDIKSLVHVAAQNQPAADFRPYVPLRQISSGRLDLKRTDRTYRPPMKVLPADKLYSIRRHSAYNQLEAPSSGAQSVEGQTKSTRAERNWIWRGRKGSTAGLEIGTPGKKAA